MAPSLPTPTNLLSQKSILTPSTTTSEASPQTRSSASSRLQSTNRSVRSPAASARLWPSFDRATATFLRSTECGLDGLLPPSVPSAASPATALGISFLAPLLRLVCPSLIYGPAPWMPPLFSSPFRPSHLFFPLTRFFPLLLRLLLLTLLLLLQLRSLLFLFLAFIRRESVAIQEFLL